MYNNTYAHTRRGKELIASGRNRWDIVCPNTIIHALWLQKIFPYFPSTHQPPNSEAVYHVAYWYIQLCCCFPSRYKCPEANDAICLDFLFCRWQLNFPHRKRGYISIPSPPSFELGLTDASVTVDQMSWYFLLKRAEPQKISERHSNSIGSLENKFPSVCMCALKFLVIHWITKKFAVFFHSMVT